MVGEKRDGGGMDTGPLAGAETRARLAGGHKAGEALLPFGYESGVVGCRGRGGVEAE
jgi:hypothetical protein